MISVRATLEEKKRVSAFAAEIIRANRYVTEADVLRELIGIEDTGLITPEMRKRLLPNRPDDHDTPTHVPASERLRSIANGAPVKASRIGRPSRKGGRK